MESSESANGAGQNELWPGWLPDWVWGPLASALLVMLAGGIGLVFGEPWLFPSLGPTAYVLVDISRIPQPSSTVVVGHLLAMGSGMLAVWVAVFGEALRLIRTGEKPSLAILLPG